LFCDIKGGRILGFNPANGEGHTLEVGGQPSFVFPTEDGKLLFGSGREIKLIDGEGEIATAARIETSPRNRTNDGTVDALGRLWFGVSDDPETQPGGSLFRYNDGRMIPVLFDMVVPNGPALTADCRTLYHVDSGNRLISRFEVTSAGALSMGDHFLQFSEDDGYPDGIVLDSEDCLWVAMWDGGCVRRYSPQGELLQRVEFPCSRITKLAFGGPELSTAYVTSARTGLSDVQLAMQPLAGALFAFDAPIAGRSTHAVKLGIGGNLGLIEDDDH